MTTSSRLIFGVMALAVVTGLCLGTWATISQNPAVAGMWVVVVIAILALIAGGRNGSR